MTIEKFQKAAKLYQEISDQENRIETFKGIFNDKTDSELLEITVSIKSKGVLGEFVYMIPKNLNEIFINEIMNRALTEENMTLVCLKNIFSDL